MNLLHHHSRRGHWAESSHVNAGLPKPYKTLTENCIKNLQESDISTVSAALSVPRGVACSLLFSNSWDLHSACDQWLTAAAAANPPQQGSTPKHVICNICFEKFRPHRMASAGCGHLFCTQCWRSYVANAIKDGAACLTLRCPENGCGAAVTTDMVERFASDSKIEKYHRHLRRSYVESNPNRKWCPAPGCDLAIEFEFGGSTIHDVVCVCSHTFCFLCAAESHRPVSCKVAAEWLEKNKSEAKSAAWIVSNTKPCPSCHRPIQKTHGCDHMTCKAPCRFRFCWNCLSPMKNHGATCRTHTAEEKGKMKRPTSDASRYAHHRERWEFHDKSRKAALAGEGAVRRWENGVCGGGVGADCGVPARAQVELRGEAEAALVRLQRCAEEEMGDEGVYVDEEKFRGFEERILNLTGVTRKCFENLVVASENCLTEVGSSKTSKRQKTSETRPEYQNSKRHMFYSDSSDFDSDSLSSDSLSSDFDDSLSSDSLSSDFDDSLSSDSLSSDLDDDLSSDSLSSDLDDYLSSDSSDFLSEHEEPKRHKSSSSSGFLPKSKDEESMRHKYSSSEHEKSRRHNSSLTRHEEPKRHKSSSSSGFLPKSKDEESMRHKYSSSEHEKSRRLKSSSTRHEEPKRHKYSSEKPRRHNSYMDWKRLKHSSARVKLRRHNSSST
ncbi:RBR-type E3 ubiquitin transferase [Salvia divinorum]|uniref:RBR-type E3 ubiquitin transferase n=1 Tax=Salvia divinorum TaxID=28513 RepID=A0ABD1GE81_SALDI